MTDTVEAPAQAAQKWVGAGVPRKEDPELITGQAQYVDNITLPGMLWLAFVRSPYAHERINGIDTSAAKQIEGVVEVFTAADLDAELAPLPCAWPVQSRNFPEEPHDDPHAPDHFPLTKDKARYVGDAVAVVVADSRAHAKDAVEAVQVDWEPLDPVLDVEAGAKPDAPRVHEQFENNTPYTWRVAVGEVDQVFADAPVVVKERYVHPRLIPTAIEPRGLVVQPFPAMGEFTLWSATQIPHILRTTLSLTTGIPETKLRVIAPDVGGGFGSKLNVYAEEALALILARKLGRPLKWIEERQENYLATTHGRGVIQDMELAATEEGKILGVRAKLLADMGGYYQLITPGVPLLGGLLYCGVYDMQAYSFECTGVFTNKTPTDAYRGAGRPEAAYAIERIVDALARRVGKDPAEVRRMNFLPKFTDEPHTSVAGLAYDSGDYAAPLDRALELAGYDELRREQKERVDRGDTKRLGIGISEYIEICGIAPSQVLAALKFGSGGWDTATIRCHPTGKVTVITGTSPHGQGHETSWAQIAADALGVGFEDVEVLHGDTAVSTLGLDTYGSRSLAVGGIAVHFAAERIREKAMKIAAHELEVAADDLVWEDGKFQVRGAPDKAKTIPELAFSAWLAHNLPEGVEPGLEAQYVFDPPNFTFPFGAHVCVVEIDTETGHAEIQKYVAVDDCGNVVNPIIVDGQVHGGVAQGIAEALYEEAVYDDTGNLLSSSMHSYRIPSAAEVPSFVVDRTVTPSTTNPLGVKGIGEAGTIASPGAVLNAVADALAPLGVTTIDKPATPERVWRAIRDAKGGAA